MTLCEQYQLGPAERQAYLRLLGLDQCDAETVAQTLTKVIAPCVDEVVAEFYEHLLAQPQAEALLHGLDDLSHLKRVQRDFILSLGQGFDTEEYFEERLKVGLAHARIGMSLSLYQGSYTLMQRLLVRRAPVDDVALYASFVEALMMVGALDMSLAIESYHATHVDTLNQSISVLKDERRFLRRKARVDGLTNIVNRTAALEELTNIMDDSVQSGMPLAICMLDIDHFKLVNDTYGHQTGDFVLQQISARIKHALRQVDLVGRYGGEEFVVILPQVSLEVAKSVAERIRYQVAKEPVMFGNEVIPVTVSIGLTELAVFDEVKSIIGRADAALYRAKKEGRNCVVSCEAREDALSLN